MVCIEKQQGNQNNTEVLRENVKGKLELIAEGMECLDRGTTVTGWDYCRRFDRKCPFFNPNDYQTLLTAEFFACDYHKMFEGVDK